MILTASAQSGATVDLLQAEGGPQGMLIGGFGPFIFLSALADPPLIVAAVCVGLAARRWWQLLPGSVLPPLAYWAFYATIYEVDHMGTLLPFLFVAGAIWSAAAHALKRHWTR